MGIEELEWRLDVAEGHISTNPIIQTRAARYTKDECKKTVVTVNFIARDQNNVFVPE